MITGTRGTFVVWALEVLSHRLSVRAEHVEGIKRSSLKAFLMRGDFLAGFRLLIPFPQQSWAVQIHNNWVFFVCEHATQFSGLRGTFNLTHVDRFFITIPVAADN